MHGPLRNRGNGNEKKKTAGFLNQPERKERFKFVAFRSVLINLSLG